MNGNSYIKSATIEAVVVRADGTVKPLGVVSFYHKNPFIRFAHWVKKKLKRG